VAPPRHIVWDTSILRQNGTPTSTFNLLNGWTHGALGAGRIAATPR
jgi:hypothetical protein